MEQRLDLTLPSSRKGSYQVWPTYVLLVAVLAVAGANTALLVIGLIRPSRPSSTSIYDNLKDLATRLYQRNLYEQAATAWQEYIDKASPSPTERAKALFQKGICLEKAGRYADAIDAFYRSEAVAKVDELTRQIEIHIKDCLEQLGRFSALRYELMARTSYRSKEDTSSKVVAEIGPEKITEADLSDAIESAIELQLAPVATFVTAEQLNVERRRLLERYTSATGRLEFLRSWMAQELLYRQALDQGLGQQDRTKRLIERLTRQLLAQRMMDEVLASRIHITESDLFVYYQANKQRYSEPNEDPNKPPRVRPFADVRDQVLVDLAQQKRSDVQTSYLQELMDRYHAVIHTSAFGEPNANR